MRRAQTFLLLFCSGAIMPLALAPFDLWPVAILSMSLLFWALENQTLKQAMIKTTVYGFGLFFAGVSWVYISIHEHGFIAAPLALAGTTLFCLFIALIFAAPFMISALIPNKSLSWMLGFPAIWVLSEWVRGWIFTGFPWLYVGYSHTDTWLNGWAPVGGVLWLSFVSAMGAAVIVQLAHPERRNRQTYGFAALVISLGGSGYGLQQVDWTEPTGAELSVVLVQPNVDQEDRWSMFEQESILATLSRQTETHWGADIIIWPEGAIPALPRQIMDYLMEIDDRAKVNQTVLLTGIPTQDARQRRYYNSILALGEARGQYDKTRLVPFGEYVPLESMLRGLNSFFDLPMSSFSRGASNQSLLTAKGEPIATAICYEIAYPNLVASSAADATMILTVSNDAWFGRSIAPQQHMQMARMRASENAKPLMRGTNNGLTALVDHRGVIVQQLQQFREAELSGTIEPRTGRTLFSHVGSWPIVLLSLLICLVLILSRRRKKN